MGVMVDGGIGRGIGRLRVAGIVDVHLAIANAVCDLKFGSSIRVGPVVVSAMRRETEGAECGVAVRTNIDVSETESDVACGAGGLGSYAAVGAGAGRGDRLRG
jgi:hypothetical protein